MVCTRFIQTCKNQKKERTLKSTVRFGKLDSGDINHAHQIDHTGGVTTKTAQKKHKLQRFHSVRTVRAAQTVGALCKTHTVRVMISA